MTEEKPIKQSENPSPATSELSLSGKNPKLVEAMNRIGEMMLENLLDPECHPTPIRDLRENGKPSAETIAKG